MQSNDETSLAAGSASTSTISLKIKQRVAHVPKSVRTSNMHFWGGKIKNCLAAIKDSMLLILQFKEIYLVHDGKHVLFLFKLAVWPFSVVKGNGFC